jgi:NAD(P)H-hydrate epimerase
MTPWQHPSGTEVPEVTADQMRNVDRVMTEDYGVQLLQMMELVGRHLAVLVRTRFLHETLEGARIMVLTGTGGNGGGVLAAARRLSGWGARVRIVTAVDSESFRGAAGHQLETLRRLGVPSSSWDRARSMRTPDLILDGVIGYGLRGQPRAGAAAMIGWVNGVSAPVVSLDVPSGLDATTGEPGDPTVLAAATLTLGLPKAGLGVSGAAAHVGELYLADIGIPPAAYEALGVDVGPVFEHEDLVHLRRRT